VNAMQQAVSRPFADVARHEAGHAIVCALLRVPVPKITFSSAERGITSNGRVKGTRSRTNDRLWKKRMAASVRIIVAGPLAERMPYGDSDLDVLDELKRAESDALRPFWTDAGPFRFYIESCDLSEERAVLRARRHLRRYWGAVLALASVLETRCEKAVRLTGMPPLHSNVPIVEIDTPEAATLIEAAFAGSRTR
jgi:hypothetical protein